MTIDERSVCSCSVDDDISNFTVIRGDHYELPSMERIQEILNEDIDTTIPAPFYKGDRTL